MSKKAAIIILAVLTMHSIASAQSSSMAVPCGSFEQWTSHSGYSVTVFFVPVSVYSSFSTPTGWDYLSYPVNETMSLMGSSININTNLPLVKASQETGTVPAGNSALKLQTFMLSDIISSTVYSVASGSLDTTLTNTVYPSILSTGTIDIDHFIPLMNSLMSNIDSAEALLADFADVDVDYYIDGGIALGGFVPSRLTGSYKYHSAIGGDNGGVVLLGTRYNSTLGRREVVGGGACIDLSDCTGYTPFTVEYLSLHDLDSSYAQQTPDSLVVMLVSSASLNRQQGSWLCVDNLVLWHDPCAGIDNLSAAADIHEAVVSWSVTGSVNGFELEYGPTGFTPGSGTTANPAGTTHTLTGLDAGTQYDVHLRTLCSNGIYGDWATLSFTTLHDSCSSILGLSAVADIHEAAIGWSTLATVDGFEVEYGQAGFQQGCGTWLQPVSDTCTLTGLDAGTTYDLYIRSVCGFYYGDWRTTQFTTLADTCARIVDIAVDTTLAHLTAGNLVEGYAASWTSSFQPQAWIVEYGPDGADTATADTLQTPACTLAPLPAGRLCLLRVRTLCGDSIYGDWASVLFRTMDTIPVDTSTAAIRQPLAGSLLQLTIAPNPANGRCTATLAGIADAEWRLYSSDGRLLQTLHGSEATFTLPSQGVYMLLAVTPEGTLTRKIVNRR